MLQESVNIADFGSAKSKFGHAEAAAGVLGVWHAAQRLKDGATQPLPHLRTPNPHVIGALKTLGSNPRVELPRQGGPCVGALVPRAPLIGVSSFAFQVLTPLRLRMLTSAMTK